VGAAPVGAAPGGGPPPRRGTGEHHPVAPRHATGEQPVLDLPRRGAAELRRQAGRKPVIALAVAALVLLAGLPAAFLIHDTSVDPVFAGLDALSLPAWAAQTHQDTATGSRWCVHECRLRERTWRSAKPAPATDPVYQQALTEAGWQPRSVAACPRQATGVATCWQHDGYVLDLWTRDAPCDLSNVAPVPARPDASGGPGPDPNAGIPSPGASGPPATCQGALVTVKVTDRYNPDRPA
jgi:hypothetical protein